MQKNVCSASRKRNVVLEHVFHSSSLFIRNKIALCHEILGHDKGLFIAAKLNSFTAQTGFKYKSQSQQLATQHQSTHELTTCAFPNKAKHSCSTGMFRGLPACTQDGTSNGFA